MLAVDRVVQASHLLFGHFSAQRTQRLPDLRMFHHKGIADERHGIVWREVVFVVLQYDQTKRGDETIR